MTCASPGGSGTAVVTRLLLVGDHALLRSGVRLLLEAQGGIEVVGEATDCRTAVALAGRLRPDVVLVDLDLAEGATLPCVKSLAVAAPGVRVLVLTGAGDRRVHRQAIRAGARGIVDTDMAPATLLKAIERVRAGELWVERSLVAGLLDELAEPCRDVARAHIAELTPREREVVALIAQGLKNKEIAERLAVSDVTVRHHLTSVFGKLGVKDRLTLVIFAFRHGLADLPPLP